MDESDVDGALGDVDVGSTVGVDAGAARPASEAFGRLANEVRVSVLLHLLEAERAGETPVSFSGLEEAADTDTSAGFAYHLRQLSGQFVRKTESGYVLTEDGRRAARMVASGAFTGSRSAS